MHSFSEKLMAAAFAMNNFTQINPEPKMSFITLRTRLGIFYCSKTREVCINHYLKKKLFLFSIDRSFSYMFRVF